MSVRKLLAQKFFSQKKTASKCSSNRDLKKIIDGCKNNKKDSQERLYKTFYGYALGVALAYCSNRADAIEVVNDSFIKTFRHIHTYKKDRPFKPWFRRIVVNTAIDKERSVKRYYQQLNIEDVDIKSPVNIESELNAQQIYNLLDELSELLRFVFNLYEIEGYSHREIAEKLDIAESSSRTYLSRAKVQLRKLYENKFVDER